MLVIWQIGQLFPFAKKIAYPKWEIQKSFNFCIQNWYLVELHENDGAEDKDDGDDEEEDGAQVDPFLISGKKQRYIDLNFLFLNFGSSNFGI